MSAGDRTDGNHILRVVADTLNYHDAQLGIECVFSGVCACGWATKSGAVEVALAEFDAHQASEVVSALAAAGYIIVEAEGD